MLGTEQLSWADAEEMCRIFDPDLVVIETSKENDFVKRLLNSQHSISRVWIGATDVFHEGQFSWLRTFQRVSFTDWSQGESNMFHGPNSEDCVQMRKEHNWQWNDESCVQPDYFVCEISYGGDGGDLI